MICNFTTPRDFAIMWYYDVMISMIDPAEYSVALLALASSSPMPSALPLLEPCTIDNREGKMDWKRVDDVQFG